MRLLAPSITVDTARAAIPCPSCCLLPEEQLLLLPNITGPQAGKTGTRLRLLMKRWCSSNEHNGAEIPLWMNNYLLIKHCLLFPTHLFSIKCEWNLLHVKLSSDTFQWHHQEVFSLVMLIIPPGALKNQKAYINVYTKMYNLCRWKTFPCNSRFSLDRWSALGYLFFHASRFCLTWSSSLIKSILQCDIDHVCLLFMPLEPGREG